MYFNYNGHTWEAYETLGLPAGSGLAEIQKAYEALKAQMDKQSHSMIDAAYQALLKKN